MTYLDCSGRLRLCAPGSPPLPSPPAPGLAVRAPGQLVLCAGPAERERRKESLPAALLCRHLLCVGGRPGGRWHCNSALITCSQTQGFLLEARWITAVSGCPLPLALGSSAVERSSALSEAITGQVGQPSRLTSPPPPCLL